MSALWTQSLKFLESDLSEQQFHSWIRPLKAIEEDGALRLIAPSPFMLEWIGRKLLVNIQHAVSQASPANTPEVLLEVGEFMAEAESLASNKVAAPVATPVAAKQTTPTQRANTSLKHKLNPSYTFKSFVEGKANQLAAAAARQVAENPGGSYNPFFIYGGVGLGKTHLMHAIGNSLVEKNPKARVAYLHSESFVSDMVTALRHNKIDEFKKFYRSLDALLIDDIQFFANKEQTQEEFFHTFNTLLEGNKQVILTSDRFPKEVDGLEDRLKSRFGWGLTIGVEPPEFEMRVAILMKKASEIEVVLPEDVAFFIAKRLRGNVRDLEGALKRVIAFWEFTQKPLTVELVKEALRDLLALQQKMVTMENIQKTVADYYKLRTSDLLSQSRTRRIARPRQLAMALSKELTNHSLPEIGDAFGGKDHTTVLHAVRRIKELRETEQQIDNDFNKLIQIITT